MSAQKGSSAREIEGVLSEGSIVAGTGDSAVANFMLSVRKAVRRIELTYGPDAVTPALEILTQSDVSNLASGPLLAMVTRNVETQKSVFDGLLEKLLPEADRTQQHANPQAQAKIEFAWAAEEAAKHPIAYDDRLIEVVVRHLRSEHAAVATSALKACEMIGTSTLTQASYDLFKSGAPPIESRALLTAARLSVFHPENRTGIIDIIYDKAQDASLRTAALETLLTPLEVLDRPALLGSDDPTVVAMLEEEEFLLKGLLDMASEETARAIGVAVSAKGVSMYSPEILRRLARSPFVAEAMRREAAKLIVAQQQNEVSLITGLSGAAIHRNSTLTSSFVGHAGVSVSNDGRQIIDCNTGRDPDAVKRVSYDTFRDGIRDCWGFRHDEPRRANLRSVVSRANEVASWRTEYDGNHLNQKGQWFDPITGGPAYWECDCVGFTEDCYERSGGNPTDNSYEFNAGWPLTVDEQRDSMRKIADCL